MADLGAAAIAAGTVPAKTILSLTSSGRSVNEQMLNKRAAGGRKSRFAPRSAGRDGAIT
jgi:hypothetical protein